MYMSIYKWRLKFYKGKIIKLEINNKKIVLKYLQITLYNVEIKVLWVYHEQKYYEFIVNDRMAKNLKTEIKLMNFWSYI